MGTRVGPESKSRRELVGVELRDGDLEHVGGPGGVSVAELVGLVRDRGLVVEGEEDAAESESCGDHRVVDGPPLIAVELLRFTLGDVVTHEAASSADEIGGMPTGSDVDESVSGVDPTVLEGSSSGLGGVGSKEADVAADFLADVFDLAPDTWGRLGAVEADGFLGLGFDLVPAGVELVAGAPDIVVDAQEWNPSSLKPQANGASEASESDDEDAVFLRGGSP